MFSNYLKIAVRNIIRRRFYSMINIVGLAIGIAGFILIGLWVRDEVSYDRHFKHADRIYRIANGLVTDNVNSLLAQADPRIATHIREEYSSIGQVTRMHHLPSLYKAGNKTAFETGSYYADTNFFSVFSYDLLQGDPGTALHRKDAIIISNRIAKKLFGTTPAMGKEIYVKNERTNDSTPPRVVTGILNDNMPNAHFHTDVLLSTSRYMDEFQPTYILFNKGYDPRQFEKVVWPAIYNKHFKKEYEKDGQGLTLNLQPLTSIHLQSNLLWEHEGNASLSVVYLFSIIAVFILLIAAINYTNLATAAFYDRSKEVSIRKVIGATKRQIIIQFLVESVALSFVALILALSVVEVSLPWFNKLANKTLRLELVQPATLTALVLVTLLAGLISGAYPAFFASSGSPARLINGNKQTEKSRPHT